MASRKKKSSYTIQLHDMSQSYVPKIEQQMFDVARDLDPEDVPSISRDTRNSQPLQLGGEPNSYADDLGGLVKSGLEQLSNLFGNAGGDDKKAPVPEVRRKRDTSVQVFRARSPLNPTRSIADRKDAERFKMRADHYGVVGDGTVQPTRPFPSMGSV